MKQISKRLTCLLMILILCCSLLSYAGASKNVVLTAINDSFLPLSAGTMPTRQNGEYYVPYTVFSSRLNLRTTQRDGILTLSSGNSTLTFNTAAGTVYDQNMNSYTSPAYKINGTIYVPVRLVCGRFGFSYSTLHSGDTLILRICSSAASLSDSEFLSSMNSTIRSMLNAYNGKPDPGTPVQPNDPAPVKKPSSIRFILHGPAGEATDPLLARLKALSQYAVFALPLDFEGYSNALLREITADRHTFAFSVSAEDPASVEMLSQANQRLFDATGMTSRLLFIEPDAGALTSAQRDLYTQAGYRLWDATHTMNSSASASKNVSTLTRDFAEITSAVILSIPHTDTASKVVSDIVNYMQTNIISSHKIDLLSTPINHANDRR